MGSNYPDGCRPGDIEKAWGDAIPQPRSRREKGAKTVSMTKKDFVALARALRGSRPAEDDYSTASDSNDKLEQWQADVAAVAEVCAKANPSFKRDKWLDAVELAETKPDTGPEFRRERLMKHLA
jgi:hypothetical protein